jgi:hypothetical protein
MAKISTWPGSSSFEVGDTAFGFYDEDVDFQTDAPNVARWCANRLGYPLVDIELQETNFFSAFEEAITEYGHQLYTFQIINNLFRIKGNATGSSLNQIYLDDYYGTSIASGQVSQGSGNSYNLTDKRLYSASLDVKRGKQRYNLLSSDPGYASATINFDGDVGESETISIINAYGETSTFTAKHNSGSSDQLTLSASMYIWPGASSSISSSFGQFSASSAAISANTFYHAVSSGSSKINASIEGTVVTLTQNVEGTDGNRSITNGLSNVTATNFSGGSSGLNFEMSGSSIQGGSKAIKIKKIYHHAPAAINRYFDPYAGTGTGIQSLMQTFGFGNYSPGVNFMLMPVYFDALKLQAIELNDYVRKSSYHFDLNAGKYLRLFPIPTRDYTLWFEYTMADSSTSPATQEAVDGTEEEKPKNLITDISNAPYERPTYRFINEPGRQWIRKYTLALSKEMLGSIRGKYQSVPIPGDTATLDYSRLLSEASSEKLALIEQLREDLEATTTLRQAERRTLESEQTQQQYTVDNPYQIYIH